MVSVNQVSRSSKFSSFISRFFLLSSPIQFLQDVEESSNNSETSNLRWQSTRKISWQSCFSLRKWFFIYKDYHPQTKWPKLSSVGAIDQNRHLRPWQTRYLTGELQALNISDPCTKSGSPRTLLSLPGSSTRWSPISVDVTFGPKQQKRHGRRPEKCILILVTPLRSSNFDPNWRLIQGEKSVTDYFSDLQDIWQELDLFLEDLSPCATCGVKFQ